MILFPVMVGGNGARRVSTGGTGFRTPALVWLEYWVAAAAGRGP
jgi:hypothetical protein